MIVPRAYGLGIEAKNLALALRVMALALALKGLGLGVSGLGLGILALTPSPAFVLIRRHTLNQIYNKFIIRFIIQLGLKVTVGLTKFICFDALGNPRFD